MNRDWWAFLLMGGLIGGLVAAAITDVVAWQLGYDAGIPVGRCEEVCAPDKLIRKLEDGACRCERDTILHAKSEGTK